MNYANCTQVLITNNTICIQIGKSTLRGIIQVYGEGWRKQTNLNINTHKQTNTQTAVTKQIKTTN